MQDESEGAAFRQDGTKFLCINDPKALAELAKYQTLYLPDGKKANLKGKYTASGFYLADDVTQSARGAIYSLRINGYDNVQLYNDAKETQAFGYRISDSTAVRSVSADELKAGDDDVAYRVFIEKGEGGNGKILVSNGGEIVQTIDFNGDCKCNYPVRPEELYFKTNSIAKTYVDYFQKRSLPIEQRLYENQELLSELTAQVIQQLNQTVKDVTFLGDELADKLVTYEQLNNRKFIVVQIPCQTLCLYQSSWNRLAEEVFKKASLSEKDILVTIPYVHCPGIGVDRGEYFYMPGVANGDGVKIDKGRLRKNYSNTQRWAAAQSNVSPDGVITFINELFNNTYKKAVHYVGFYNASNLVEIMTWREEDVCGHPFNKRLLVYKHKGCNELAKSYREERKKLQDAEDDLRTKRVVGPPVAAALGQIRKNCKNSQLDILERLSTQTGLQYFERHESDNPVRFKEEYLDKPNPKLNNTPNYEAYLLNWAYRNIQSDLNCPVGGGYSYEGSHALTHKLDWWLSAYVDKPIVSTLDAASVVLGFFALDAFPDAINCCYSSLRGNWSNAGLTLVSIAFIGPEGEAIKQSLKKAGRFFRVKNGLVEVGDNLIDDEIRAIIRRNREAFSTTQLQEIDNLSGESLRNVLRGSPALSGIEELFKRLDSPEMIIAFKADFNNFTDEAIRKTFLEKPELVDSWKVLINQPDWVRKNTKLLEKLSGESEEFVKKVDNFYSTTMKNRTPQNFTGPGLYNKGVDYNEFGFPKLREKNPLGDKYVFKSAKGNHTTDFDKAKEWLNKSKSELGYDDVWFKPNSTTFKVKKDGQWSDLLTWHHHENGIDMIPVPTELHTGLPHVGGVETVKQGINHLFNY